MTAQPTAPEPALRECPFCGSKNIDPAGWMSGNGSTGPACDDCGASAGSHNFSQEKNVELWNTRAAAPEVAALAKAVRALIDAIDYHGGDHHQDGCAVCMAIVKTEAALALAGGGGDG